MWGRLVVAQPPKIAPEARFLGKRKLLSITTAISVFSQKLLRVVTARYGETVGGGGVKS